MPTYEFNWIHLPNAAAPIRSGNNCYSCFDSLEDTYGAYLFHDRGAGTVRYVGSAGKIGNPSRHVLARIKQHYTKSKTGATLYKRWHHIEHPNWDGELFAHHDPFLQQLRQWSLSALVTADHSAVGLVPAIEHTLIHRFRPLYQDHPESPGCLLRELSAVVRVDDSGATLEVRDGQHLT